MYLRLTALSCTFLAFAWADTLYLRSGTTIQGNYAGGDTRQIRIMVGDHVETYPVGDVMRLEFNNSGRAAMPAVPPPPPPADAPQTPRYTERPAAENFNSAPPPATYNNAPPPSNYASGLEIPAGTNLVIRMIDNVDSERDSMGQTFRGSMDEPVMVNGQIVIPRGADVVAKLVNERESGKFRGTAALTLALMQVQVNGRMVDVTTSEVTQASGSRGSRTAKTVGGGAVAGAIIGGLIGGGKGAAIGAASGGTLGAGAEVLTKGQKVKIPSETRLSFLLQQPIRL